MAIKLGEIFVSLGLSTASFTKNLNDAKKLAFGNAKEIERSFQLMGKAALAAGTAIGTALIVMTRAGINTAAQFHDLSQSTGVAVETLSSLAVVAKTAGLDTQTLATLLGKLAKNMAQAASGSKEQSRAFQLLGISVRDSSGGLRSIEDVLGDVAERFVSMEDGTGKTALAMQLFGKSGMAMIPLLNEGKSGLAAMTEQAKRLGLVISSDTAKAADRFNDDLDILKKQLEAVGIGIASEILPNLTKMSGGLLAASGNAQELGRTLGSVFSKVTIGLGEMGLEMEIAFAHMARGMLLLAATAPVLGFLAGDVLGKKAQELKDFIGGLQAQLVILRQPIEALAPGGAAPRKGGGAPIIDEQAAAAAKKHAEAIQGIIGKLRQEIATFGMSGVAVNVYKAALEGASPAQQRMIHNLGITVQQLEFMRKKLLDIAVVPTFQMPAGAEELDAVIENMALQMAGFAKNTEQAIGELAKLGIELPKLVKPLSVLQQDMLFFAERSLQAFGDWIIFGGSFRQTLQGILQDLARVIFQLTVIDPLMKSIFGAMSKGGSGGGGGLFGFLGSLLGGLFGGGSAGGLSGGAHHTFAHGGRPPVGQFSLVGERGPELFMPDVRGRIVPHEGFAGLTGAGGVTIINNIDNRGADLGTTAKTAMLVNRLAMKQFAQLMHERGLRTA